MNLKNSVTELLILNPNYFSFLAGVFISTSVNIYAGIFVTDNRPTKLPFLLIASGLLFISGFFWTRIAWRLEVVQRALERMEKTEPREALIQSELSRFSIYFTVACSTAVAGLLILIV